MVMKKSDEPASFERHYANLSSAALWLKLVDNLLLAPLDEQERKDFRARYLRGVSGIIDRTIRSESFLETLNNVIGFFAPAQKPAPVSPAVDMLAEVLQNEAMRELLVDHLASAIAEQVQARLERNAASVVKATANTAHSDSVHAPSEAPRDRPSANGVASQPVPSQRQILDAMRETNRQLAQLIALQVRSSTRNGCKPARHSKKRFS
jgi:hypothetical protein